MSNLMKFYIDGAWVSPNNAKPIDVINPATEEPCAQIALGNSADVDKAVAAAKAAFATWGYTAPQERMALMEKLVEVYKRRSGEMAEAISKEMGAPISMANSAQAAAGIGHLRAFIDVMKNFTWEHALNEANPQELAHEPSRLEGWRGPGGGLHHGAQAFRNRALVLHAVC